MNTKNYKKYIAILLVANSFVTGYAGAELQAQKQHKQGWSNKQVACMVVPLAVTAAGLGVYAVYQQGIINILIQQKYEVENYTNKGQGCNGVINPIMNWQHSTTTMSLHNRILSVMSFTVLGKIPVLGNFLESRRVMRTEISR